MSKALVWLKHDLRLHDQAALAAAATMDQAVALFVIEPEWLSSPECAPQHVAFTLASLAVLRADLAARGLPLLVRVGRVCQVLGELRREFPFDHLFSHEETGSGWSYTRDLAVAAWCREQAGLSWQEFTQTGVVRRLRSRFGWAGRWQHRMDAALIADPAGFGTPHGSSRALQPSDLPSLADLGLAAPQQPLPSAGEAAGRQVLESFLQGRGADYRSAMSSPLTAADSCSRLSAHLAFGSLSMRQVHQASEVRIADLRRSTLEGAAGEARALRSFTGRLRWHCHFMQKLEDEPRIEFENFARVCDGLRGLDEALFAAWSQGRTGFPMVDACLRSLCATGWLNFRMRAMLVSFAAYHLWLDWRQPGLFLARQFLDFEPGIHWSQMQMQSGCTGINTLRIYSPTKQAQDQDPDGVFIRRWLPELAQVPLPYLAQPWLLTPAQQQASGCRMGLDYPLPIIDERAALARAKQVLYGLRAQPEARGEAAAVQQKHGSRKSGMAQTGMRSAAKKSPRRAALTEDNPQLDLFG